MPNFLYKLNCIHIFCIKCTVGKNLKAKVILCQLNLFHMAIRKFFAYLCWQFTISQMCTIINVFLSARILPLLSALCVSCVARIYSGIPPSLLLLHTLFPHQVSGVSVKDCKYSRDQRLNVPSGTRLLLLLLTARPSSILPSDNEK
jgi:hypothetical protein